MTPAGTQVVRVREMPEKREQRKYTRLQEQQQ
jgi:hypothetical protein